MYTNEFRPMKRQHSPDYEGNFRQFKTHPNYQFNKRHRGHDGGYNTPLTLEEKIARLGMTGARNSDIGMLAKDIDADLLNKAAEEEKIKAITSKICACIVSYPSRVASYATLIGLISVKHYNVSCQIINTLHASYPVYLEAQKWQEALTIIHLLSSLVNCKVIRPSALLSQFELLLEITLEDNIPQARSDYYVYTVLSSLPYVALELSAQSEQHTFEQILNTIETYLSKRSKDHLKVTRVWLSSDSTVQMDYLDSLWVQTKNFRANNWNEMFLHRPYYDKEYKDIMASSLIPQNSPTIQIPAHSADYVYPSPRIVFRIFEDDVVEGQKPIPGSDKIERFCIENHIRNIIDELPTERIDCARHLSHMYRSDQLPMKHMLIETLLGELFTLPKPKHQELLYHSLLYEFTKIFHSKNTEDPKLNFDVVLNEAVKVLYENLDTMNVTCFDRFVEWFSFHLNNTEFLFPWQNWTDATFKEKHSPKSVFVQNILSRCLRLSFHKKISALVNENLSGLMPAEASVEYRPINATHPKADELAGIIKKMIVNKDDMKTISETLNVELEGVEMPEDFVFKEEKHSEKLMKLDIFTAVVLHIASRSLTHVSSAMGKFRVVFKALARVEGGQDQLLQTIQSCLTNHSQLQVILVDKLLKAELVEAKEICDWLFSQSMQPHQLKDHPWELLNNTISRVFHMIQNLNKKKDEPQPAPEVKVEEGEDVQMKDAKGEIEAKIEQLEAYHDMLILHTFENFADILGDHIRKCEVSNTNYMDDWFRWITGRMQQVYYRHYHTTHSHFEEIKSIVEKTPSIGNSIMNLNY